jgi:hypothetical protein
MSVKSVLHQLIDDIHGTSGHSATNLELHQEVENDDTEKEETPDAEES